MARESDTFWGGKEEARRDLLQAFIPGSGKVLDPNRPALEEWRKLQNVYYRFYNDGDPYAFRLRHMAKRHGINFKAHPTIWVTFEIKGKTYTNDYDGGLEALADKVFAAAWAEYEATTKEVA